MIETTVRLPGTNRTVPAVETPIVGHYDTTKAPVSYVMVIVRSK